MAVNEAEERMRAAISTGDMGRHMPMRRITVNLAPADLRKEGPSYDLPMAVVLLAATEVRASCVVAEEAQGLLKAAMRRTTRSAWPS